MNDLRFPNIDEKLVLRSQGHVAVSNYSCRLIAGTFSLIFLLTSNIADVFKQILSVNKIDDPTLLEGSGALLTFLVISVAVYLLAYSVSALLQTRFYFNPGAIFLKKGSFFSFVRGCSFFKVSALVSTIAILCLSLLALLIWKETFFLQLELLYGASPKQILDILLKSCYKIGLMLLILMLLPLAVALVFSKLGFNILHRVKTRRG